MASHGKSGAASAARSTYSSLQSRCTAIPRCSKVL
jgi:hypothetical protein